MGLFSKTEKSSFPWQMLNSMEEYQALLSNSEPTLIFKHSTRCGISRMALKEFEKKWDTVKTGCKLYYLDLLNHRDISNSIEQDFNVQHQSPQVVVFSNKEVLYHASHHTIDAQEIQKITD